MPLQPHFVDSSDLLVSFSGASSSSSGTLDAAATASGTSVVAGSASFVVAGTVYMVPESIDQTGTTDVTDDLNTFIASVPDGTEANPSIIRFQPGAHYRTDNGTVGTPRDTAPAGYQRNWLVFDGNGCTIDKSQVEPTSGGTQAGVGLHACSNVTIKNFTVLGQHPNPGNLATPFSDTDTLGSGGGETGGYKAAHEHKHGIAAWGCTNVVIRDCHLHASYGDGVELSGANDYVADPKGYNATVENVTVYGTGRMGVALTSNDGVTIRNVNFDLIGYHVVDIEPETGPVLNVLMEDCFIERLYLGVISAAAGFDYDRGNIVYRNNVMTTAGRTTFPCIYFTPTNEAHTSLLYNIVVEGNTFKRLNYGGWGAAGEHNVIRFRAVDGLTTNSNEFGDWTTDEAAVGLFDVVTPTTVNNNNAPNAPHIYWVDNVAHGPGVDACGNTTSAGTDQPVPCVGTVYMVPESIDQTGTTDVATALNTFIREQVPDGTEANPSIIKFQPGATYRIDHCIGYGYGTVKAMAGHPTLAETSGWQRSWLTLDGNGCTLDWSQPLGTDVIYHGNGEAISFMGPSHHITVKNFTTIGSYNYEFEPITPNSDHEWYFGINLTADDCLVQDCTFDRNWGDAVHTIGDRIVIERVTADGCGRMGVSFVKNDDCVLRDSWFDRCAFAVVDLEPETGPVTNILIEGNSFGTHWYSCIAAAAGVLSDRIGYTIRNNVMRVSGRTSWCPVSIFHARWDGSPNPEQDWTGKVENHLIEGNTFRGLTNAWLRGAVNIGANPYVKGRNIVVRDNTIIGDYSYRLVNFVNCTPAEGLQVKNNVLQWNINASNQAIYASYLEDVGDDPSVDACGNTTYAGTDIPTAC